MERSRARLVLAGFAVLAIAGISAAMLSGGGGGKSTSADKQQVASIAQQGLRDLGTQNYSDLCAHVAPSSPLMANGVDGCVSLMHTSTGGTTANGNYLMTIASTLTVDANQITISGDNATVPLSAIQHDGAPLTDTSGMKDEALVRINNQWYIVPN